MRLEHLLSGARDLNNSHRSVAAVPVSGQSVAVGDEYGERQKSPTPAHAQCIAVEHRLSVSTHTERESWHARSRQERRHPSFNSLLIMRESLIGSSVFPSSRILYIYMTLRPCAQAEEVARGFSSAGRAPALQAGGQRFESVILHKREKEVIDMLGTREKR